MLTLIGFRFCPVGSRVTPREMVLPSVYHEFIDHYGPKYPLNNLDSIAFKRGSSKEVSDWADPEERKHLEPIRTCV